MLFWWSLALLSAAPPAESIAARGPVRLAVVPVIVASGEKPPSSTIFAAVWGAARSRINLTVMSEEEAFVSSEAELSEHVLECGADTKCVAEQLKSFGIGLGLMIVLNLDLDPPLLGLQLIDCTSGALAAESIGPLADKELAKGLIKEIRQRAAKIFDDAGFK